MTGRGDLSLGLARDSEFRCKTMIRKYLLVVTLPLALIALLLFSSMIQINQRSYGLYSFDSHNALPCAATTKTSHRARPLPASPHQADCRAVVKNHEVGYEYTKGGQKVNWFFQVRSGTDPFSFLIHVHTQLDVTVTPQINNLGCFECEIYYPFMRALYSQSVHDTLVLDMGANLGQYTLGAAIRGYPVMAMEPLRRNWVPFCYSLFANPNVQDGFVQIFKVALHKETEPKKLRFFHRWEHNPSATAMVADQPAQDTSNTNNTSATKEVEGVDYAWAVSLDQLSQEFHSGTFERKKLVIKVDVEGFECQALEGGFSFLSRHEIVYVAWEASKERLQECGDSTRNAIFELFHTKNQLQPYLHSIEDGIWKALAVEEWKKWNEENKKGSSSGDLFNLAWTKTKPNSTPFT